MSCAFGEIIFGWAWTDEVETAIDELSNEELEEFGLLHSDGAFCDDDANALGFETFYNASGSEVSGYLGVKLDDMNVYSSLKMSDFNVTPTEEQRQKVASKLEGLPKSLREALGEPDVWVVWGDT